MTGLRTVVLLTISNVFMTFAWYAHLRNLADKPFWIAALVSWGIAFLDRYSYYTLVHGLSWKSCG